MHSDDAGLEAELLQRLESANDRAAALALLQLVYADLRRIAHTRLQGLQGPITLRTTSLVHDGILKLVSAGTFQSHDRDHFLARAACAMRSIIVDYVRARRRRPKHVDFDEVAIGAVVGHFEERFGDVVALHEAMLRLEAIEPRAARIVELRYFADCSVDETARVLRISKRTVEREWTAARAFLAKELS